MQTLTDKEKQQRKDIIINHLIVANIFNSKRLEIMSKYPRSLFLPAELQPISNCDSAIQYGHNRYMLDMATLGNMLEIANFKSSDIVLLIGSGLGYAAAIISKLVSRVICIEENEELLEKAQGNINKLGIKNVELHQCGIKNFSLIHPFNRIFMEGAFHVIPTELSNLIDSKVDLIAIERKNNLARIVIVNKIDQKLITKYGRHTPTPYLVGFEEQDNFAF